MHRTNLPVLTQIHLFIMLRNIVNILILISNFTRFDAGNSTVMVFQAVDATFFPLWLNWWAAAVQLNSFPSNWRLFVACFGEEPLAQKVKNVHSEGCSYMIGRAVYKKHVYLAKWMAVNVAFKLGYHLMVIDLDAILIRYF